MEINTSWQRKGIEIGRREGELDFVLRHLQRWFGTLTQVQEQLVSDLPIAKIEELDEALFDMTEVADLDNWLEKNAGQSEG